jgi:type 1 glutamine amidotransferase
VKSALIVQGGWQGHQPREVSEILAGALREQGFSVDLSDSLGALVDKATLDRLGLFVPIWTMGSIEPEQLESLLEVVKGGVGIAGVHGGMGDAFRTETEYQYMVGGQWVAHPGGDSVTYTVRIDPNRSPITEGIGDFEVTSEKYYMHVDPAITVLATTDFGEVTMPVTWIKTYGKGRVFYTSLGHSAAVVRQEPVLRMVTRGMLWAAKSL